MWEINRQGCMRVVLLTKRYAVKIPNFLDGLDMFLKGILANRKEYGVYRYGGYDTLCPVLHRTPLSLIIIMPRVDVLTDDQFLSKETQTYLYQQRNYIFGEHKSNSFGYYQGRIVCIDYGD